MIVVVSHSSSMVLCKLLVMLQVQLQTVYSHHPLDFHHFDTGSGRYLVTFDWGGLPAPHVASYIATVVVSCEGISAACMGAYDQHINHVCIG